MPLRKVYRYPLNTAASHLTLIYQRTSIMQRLHNLYYRSMVWIATKLTEDIDLPQEKCNPVSLFEQMIQFKHLSWGHYVCFLCWLNGHFPLNGSSIFRYLKNTYPSYHYSWTYLVMQWGLYHGYQNLLMVRRSFGTCFLSGC